MAGGLDVSSRTPKQTNLFSECAPDHAQQLHRAVGLGHVMVAAGGTRTSYGNHWGRLQIRVGMPFTANSGSSPHFNRLGFRSHVRMMLSEKNMVPAEAGATFPSPQLLESFDARLHAR